MESTDTKVDLVINKLTKSQFLHLSAEGKTSPTELYFVDDEDFDVFNKRIVNVDYPVVENDAVNLGYLSSNFIKTDEISEYVDDARLFDDEQTSCLTYTGDLCTSRIGTNEWDVQVLKGKYTKNQITVFYNGTPGKHSTGSGWAFNCNNELTVYTGNEDYDKALLIQGSGGDNNEIVLRATRPLYWDKKDKLISAKTVYSKLSSITANSQLEDVINAIMALNNELSNMINK